MGAMRHRNSQAGAVVVEFALIFPLFIAVVGMIITISLAQWTKMHATAITFRAAAICTEEAPIMGSSMASCVHWIVDPYLRDESRAGIMPWCTDPSVDVQIEGGLVPLPQKLLHVKISCLGSWSPFLNVLWGTSGKGAGLPVAAECYMPYTLRNWSYPL